MAEENKSFFPNIGILSDTSLQGLSSEVQDQLQRDATKRMIIGGLLSGRPDIGFQSAVGVPTDYFARQQQILGQQQQAERDRAVAASYQPTRAPFNQDSEQAGMLAKQLRGLSPEDIQYESGRIVNTAMGVVPRQFNPAAFMTNALPVIARSDPTKMAEALKSMRPYTVEAGSQIRDPFTGQVTGYAPSSTEKNQQIQIDPVTGKEKVVDLPGAIESLTRRATATEGAKPTDVYDPQTGSYRAATVGEAVGNKLITKPGPGMEKSETKTAESLVDKRSNFPTAEKGINAYVEQTKFLENTIDQAIGLAKQRGTTGLVGAQAAKVQGTPAYNLRQLLDPIRNGTAFDTLKDLKANDASLGQIAVKEFEALASSKGSVDQGQTDAQLIKALTSLKDRLATGRDRVTGEYYSIYKDFALTPDRITPIIEQARQNPLNVPQGFQVRAIGEEQYLVGPNKFFQKIK